MDLNKKKPVVICWKGARALPVTLSERRKRGSTLYSGYQICSDSSERVSSFAGNLYKRRKGAAASLYSAVEWAGLRGDLFESYPSFCPGGLGVPGHSPPCGLVQHSQRPLEPARGSSWRARREFLRGIHFQPSVVCMSLVIQQRRRHIEQAYFVSIFGTNLWASSGVGSSTIAASSQVNSSGCLQIHYTFESSLISLFCQGPRSRQF